MHTNCMSKCSCVTHGFDAIQQKATMQQLYLSTVAALPWQPWQGSPQQPKQPRRSCPLQGWGLAGGVLPSSWWVQQSVGKRAWMPPTGAIFELGLGSMAWPEGLLMLQHLLLLHGLVFWQAWGSCRQPPPYSAWAAETHQYRSLLV